MFYFCERVSCSGSKYHCHFGEHDTDKDDEQYPGRGGKPDPQPSQGYRPSLNHGFTEFKENEQGDKNYGGDEAYIESRVEPPVAAEANLVVGHGGH